MTLYKLLDPPLLVVEAKPASHLKMISEIKCMEHCEKVYELLAEFARISNCSDGSKYSMLDQLSLLNS